MARAFFHLKGEAEGQFIRFNNLHNAREAVKLANATDHYKAAFVDPETKSELVQMLAWQQGLPVVDLEMPKTLPADFIGYLRR